ncbi:serine/threonine-protein kinase [Kitasatospora sp. NPDC008050]|uniref:serine/threonine-protein kinase n=1 Tax=Kitasatospora sp. NPDC008050 TaxID=3364021 RepID=UPI0036E4B38B
MTGFQDGVVLAQLRPDEPREVAGYRLLARIGEGGMGSVYLSLTRGGQPVALKLIRRELAQDEEFRRRFQQEVRSARQVQGHHVVPVLDHDTTGDRPWLATAYVPGLPLDQALAAHGTLPLPVVLHLVCGTADALQAVHAAGVIHRDLKPGNVLLAADGPWVIDFGIARAGDHTQLTRSGGLIGTPQYMSPEHANGAELTPATDVFSLGLIMAVAATGRHPYGDGGAITTAARIANTESRPPDLSGYPDQLRPLLERCLAADPTARPTAAELARLCERATGRTPRNFDDWLPDPLAADIDRRGAAVRRATAVTGTGDGAGDGAGAAAYTPTETDHPTDGAARFAAAPTRTNPVPPPSSPPLSPPSSPPPSYTSGPERESRGGKPLVIVGIAIGALVIGAFGYALTRPHNTPTPPPPTAGPTTVSSSGSASGSASPTPAAFQVVFQDVPLAVAPPDTISMGVQVDLDAPKVDPTHQMSDSDAEFNYDDDFLTFNTPTGKAANATPQACLAAANTTPLPQQLPGKALGPDGNAIKVGDLLCTVTSKGNLAMWHITGATPSNNYYRTPDFTGTLTLWKVPAGS